MALQANNGRLLRLTAGMLAALFGAAGVFVFAALIAAGGILGFPERSGAAENLFLSLPIATGGTAGLYYPIGDGLAKLLNSRLPNVDAKAETSGGSMANLALIAEGRAALALVQNNSLFGVTGKHSAIPAQNIRQIAPLYPEYVQCFAVKSSDVKMFSDLKGKRVSVGEPGSRATGEIAAALSAAGLRYADVNAEFLDFPNTAARLLEGRLDAGFAVGGIPLAAVTALTEQEDFPQMDLVAFEDSLLESLTARYPFFSRGSIPAGTYDGVGHDTPAPVLWAVLVCDARLSDELVYSITKTLFENAGELKKIYSGVNPVFPDLSANRSPAALHPGAEKYFKERAALGKQL